MKLFGFGKDTPKNVEDELARFDGELRKVQSLMRTLEAEQATMHAEVKKWMRRAVAAETRAGRNQGEGEPSTPDTPGPPFGQMTSARSRMFPTTALGERVRRRRMERAARPNGDDSKGDSDGVHS